MPCAIREKAAEGSLRPPADLGPARGCKEVLPGVVGGSHLTEKDSCPVAGDRSSSSAAVPLAYFSFRCINHATDPARTRRRPNRHTIVGPVGRSIEVHWVDTRRP